jgi:hypothetical protein
MLKNIIFEEIKKIISEGYVMSDDRFLFKQNLKNSYFHDYESFTSDYDVDITISDITITWKINFWLNQSGVENFIINVDNVDGTYILDMYDKQTDELISENQKNINEIDWKFLISDCQLSKGGSLYVSELDFDFKSNVCLVKFTE